MIKACMETSADYYRFKKTRCMQFHFIDVVLQRDREKKNKAWVTVFGSEKLISSWDSAVER